MAEAEKIKVNQDVLGLIARQATGSMRDAISILDQLASAADEVTAELAHQSSACFLDATCMANAIHVGRQQSPQLVRGRFL
jgi:DNA polymerase III gamma/tau subunit